MEIFFQDANEAAEVPQLPPVTYFDPTPAMRAMSERYTVRSGAAINWPVCKYGPTGLIVNDPPAQVPGTDFNLSAAILIDFPDPGFYDNDMQWWDVNEGQPAGTRAAQLVNEIRNKYNLISIASWLNTDIGIENQPSIIGWTNLTLPRPISANPATYLTRYTEHCTAINRLSVALLSPIGGYSGPLTIGVDQPATEGRGWTVNLPTCLTPPFGSAISCNDAKNLANMDWSAQVWGGSQRDGEYPKVLINNYLNAGFFNAIKANIRGKPFTDTSVCVNGGNAKFWMLMRGNDGVYVVPDGVNLPPVPADLKWHQYGVMQPSGTIEWPVTGDLEPDISGYSCPLLVGGVIYYGWVIEQIGATLEPVYLWTAY